VAIDWRIDREPRSMSTTAQRGASPQAISHHYDVENDFYALWLDPSMTYSCALWDGDHDDSLEAAQRRKLDYLLRECTPNPGFTLLDIGCGWGSAMTRALDTHHASRATGLTLSRAQATYVEALADERLDVRVADWTDFEPDGTFDAIVSIGAMEHFVKFGWRREDRVAAYRRFFESCHGWLKPGGKLALQAIGKGNAPLDDRGAEDVIFIAQHIFPESDLPKLSELTHACERSFEVVRVRNDRLHYAKTCRAWLNRLESCRSQAVGLVGREKCEQYERYLMASSRQFEHGHANLYRVTLQRVDR
jgi:cyclopropane-fatty-acyl-phospholipid synthase